MATCIEGLFTDLDFDRACDELEKPDLDGWEFFVESHGITIYRLHDKNSGLYSYKIYGELEDVDPEICAQVYLDLDYRKEWDNYVKELCVKPCEGRNVIYWNINYPFPLSNRDYVYGREYRIMNHKEQKTYVVLAKAIETPSLPVNQKVVRVSDFLQSCTLVSNGKQGSRAFMTYFDNPGGNIPTWLINWGAKTGVPQFLSSMQKACRGYPDYLKKNGR